MGKYFGENNPNSFKNFGLLRSPGYSKQINLRL